MATTYPIGPVAQKSVAQSGKFESDTGTSGSDGSNYWKFEILKNGSTVIFSADTNNDGELVANTGWDLGAAASAAAAALAAGDTLELRVTKTGTPTDLSGAKWKANVDVNVDLA